MPQTFFNRVQGGVQEGLSLLLEIDNIDTEGKVSVRPQFQDPWITAAEKYTIGQKYSGTIRSRTDFGFFVALEFGLEGLAHKEQNKSLWSQQPEVGSDVELYISKMDVENQNSLYQVLLLLKNRNVKIEEKHSVKKVVMSHLENYLKKLNFEANDERRSVN